MGELEEKTKEQQGKRQGKKRGKGQGGKPVDRVAEKQKKLDRKIERAAQPDTAVVSRKALETNAMVALLGQNDYFIDQLRKKVGFDTKIDVEKAMTLLQINGSIRSVVAIANAAMQHTLGMTYEPARGLDVPTVAPGELNLKKILAALQEIVTEAEATAPAPAKDAEPVDIKKAA